MYAAALDAVLAVSEALFSVLFLSSYFSRLVDPVYLSSRLPVPSSIR